ncbi:ferredoxin [Shewanella denitrificans OS217]|jgi:ferredoxin|uniref:Ferredoxin n=1 Tax=Shewanella denitrificans (strain OS217 / ATCC BAA-1090 / DSM 15013) TaxID=318161 RepID=Q12II1_SHEDO|nr:2Fe-2S iron-sulfur cluster-binding protein [Shewanella denitrificans]ABE56745.1 ferredoxin [Shewanella denitrificans OS217]
MPVVKLNRSGLQVSLANNCTLSELDNAEQSELMFGCRAAACGSCAIKVVDGLENLSPKKSSENHLLDMLCMNDDTHRLACQCKLFGDITIEALE